MTIYGNDDAPPLAQSPNLKSVCMNMYTHKYVCIYAYVYVYTAMMIYGNDDATPLAQHPDVKSVYARICIYGSFHFSCLYILFMHMYMCMYVYVYMYIFSNAHISDFTHVSCICGKSFVFWCHSIHIGLF